MLRAVTLDKHAPAIAKRRGKLAIVGGGPVGLTFGLFCNSLGIPFDLIEKRKQGICSQLPPAAHYINTRSMETFSELYDLESVIHNNAEDINKFGTYRYLRRLGELDYYVNKQFSRAVRLRIIDHTTMQPIHMPQSKLTGILEAQLCRRASPESSVLFETEITSAVNFDDRVRLQGTGGFEQEYDLVVGCDGFHSKIRNEIGIQVSGKLEIQTFVNVYFKSMKLAQKIVQDRKNAMLHFIYNSDIVACLVNHSYEEGLFVLQIPVNAKLEINETALSKSDKSQVMKILSPEFGIREEDIQIVNKGVWKMHSAVADRFNNGRIAIMGDAAHSLAPAGGLGMNTGLQDAHNLAHRLRWHHLDSNEVLHELERYGQERKTAAFKNKNKSEELYKISLDIARDLGLDIDKLKLFEGAMESFGSNSLFSLGKKFGSLFLESDFIAKNLAMKIVKRDKLIPMFLVDEETKINYNNTSRKIAEEHLLYTKSFTFFDEYCGLLAPVGGFDVALSKEEKHYLSPRRSFEFPMFQTKPHRYILLTNVPRVENILKEKDQFLIIKQWSNEQDLTSESAMMNWIKEAIPIINGEEDDFVVIIRQDGHIELVFTITPYENSELDVY